MASGLGLQSDPVQSLVTQCSHWLKTSRNKQRSIYNVSADVTGFFLTNTTGRILRLSCLVSASICARQNNKTMKRHNWTDEQIKNSKTALQRRASHNGALYKSSFLPWLVGVHSWVTTDKETHVCTVKRKLWNYTAVSPMSDGVVDFITNFFLLLWLQHLHLHSIAHQSTLLPINSHLREFSLLDSLNSLIYRKKEHFVFC